MIYSKLKYETHYRSVKLAPKAGGTEHYNLKKVMVENLNQALKDD